MLLTPIVSSAIAASVVPRSRISARHAKRTSCRSASIPGSTRVSRNASRVCAMPPSSRRAASRASRVRETAPAVLVGEQLEVRLQLLAQLVLATPAAERPEQPREQHAQARHDSGSRRRLTIATVRAQSCASASSCFRPAAVML